MRKHVACWVAKTTRTRTSTHTISNAYCSPRQQLLRKSSSTLRYTYIASLVTFSPSATLLIARPTLCRLSVYPTVFDRGREQEVLTVDRSRHSPRNGRRSRSVNPTPLKQQTQYVRVNIFHRLSRVHVDCQFSVKD
jgi:hypothetical protein